MGLSHDAKIEYWRIFRQAVALKLLFWGTLYLSVQGHLPSLFFSRFDCFFMVVVVLFGAFYDLSLTALDNLVQAIVYFSPLIGASRLYWIPIDSNCSTALTKFRKPGNMMDLSRALHVRKVTVSELTVPPRHPTEKTTNIRVVVHRKKGATHPAKALLVYFHGGGMVIGSAEDTISAQIASLQEDVVVCSVDYRLSPEHPFPAPFDDALSALLELVSPDKRAQLNLAPNAKVGVGGVSAGGALAAAVALAAPAHHLTLAGQLLLIPMLAPPESFASYSHFARCSVLPAATMGWFWRCYAPKGAETHQNMYCCPINAPSDALKHVAPAYIWTSSCDVLRDEGEAYAIRLRKAGHVNVVHVRGKGSHLGSLLSNKMDKFVKDFCQQQLIRP